MKLKQHIPNLLTLANLACGVLAIIFFMDSLVEFEKAKIPIPGFWNCFGYPHNSLIQSSIFFILLATIFDFLDGFAARLLKVQSEIGAQLDSLSYLVTFGVAPGILFHTLATIEYPKLSWLPYLGIIIPLFSAYRLAKFNIDKEQTTYFKGLATPANAIFWMGIGILHSMAGVELNPFLLTGLVLALSILMVTNLKMFSLKIKNFKLEGDNIYRLLFLFGIIVMLISTFLLGNILYSISGIILLYILLSIPYHFSKKKQHDLQS